MPSIVEFQFLRVLILKLWVDLDDMSYDLTGILKLFRLIYLHIDACHASVQLPTQMQVLQYLETVKFFARVSVVPSDIIHLPRLSHLSLLGEINLPNGIGHMTSLQTLGYFDLSSNTIDNVQSLDELTNLRGLDLTCFIVLLVIWSAMWNVWARFSENSAISNLLLTLVPAGSSHLNTLDAAGASRMSIFCDGLGSSVSSPPALPQRFEFSPRICTFSILPKWISELGKLCILKIAVRELLMNDVAILEGLPALNALSLYVRTTPAQTMIIFDQAGFPASSQVLQVEVLQRVVLRFSSRSNAQSPEVKGRFQC